MFYQSLNQLYHFSLMESITYLTSLFLEDTDIILQRPPPIFFPVLIPEDSSLSTLILVFSILHQRNRFICFVFYVFLRYPVPPILSYSPPPSSTSTPKLICQKWCFPTKQQNKTSFKVMHRALITIPFLCSFSQFISLKNRHLTSILLSDLI